MKTNTMEPNLDAMENVTGGLNLHGHSGESCCKDGGSHDFIENRREKGIIFDSLYYKCTKCGKEKEKWLFPWQ